MGAVKVQAKLVQEVNDFDKKDEAAMQMTTYTNLIVGAARSLHKLINDAVGFCMLMKRPGLCSRLCVVFCVSQSLTSITCITSLFLR